MTHLSINGLFDPPYRDESCGRPINGREVGWWSGFLVGPRHHIDVACEQQVWLFRRLFQAKPLEHGIPFDRRLGIL
jgi:hypothetical protein